MCDELQKRNSCVFVSVLKWTKYPERSKRIEFHSELLKIAQIIFAIISHKNKKKSVDKESESLKRKYNTILNMVC